MQYAILCYNQEALTSAWSKEKDDAVMARHAKSIEKFTAQGKMGPVARLMPTTTATTLRAGREQLIIDGPFAETKEQLLGFYIVDCDTLEEVLEIAKEFTHEPGALEIRPVQHFVGPFSEKTISGKANT
jgi:hypothetical protein